MIRTIVAAMALSAIPLTALATPQPIQQQNPDQSPTVPGQRPLNAKGQPAQAQPAQQPQSAPQPQAVQQPQQGMQPSQMNTGAGMRGSANRTAWYAKYAPTHTSAAKRRATAMHRRPSSH